MSLYTSLERKQSSSCCLPKLPYCLLYLLCVAIFTLLGLKIVCPMFCLILRLFSSSDFCCLSLFFLELLLLFHNKFARFLLNLCDSFFLENFALLFPHLVHHLLQSAAIVDIVDHNLSLLLNFAPLNLLIYGHIPTVY